jgi:osmotically-inducible protein OsmY
MILKRTAASFVLALALCQTVPAAVPQSDDYITDVVRQKLAADQVVKGGAIEVTVKDGAVTLAGKVPEAKMKARAERLAKGIKGVKSVVNNVKIEHP